MRSIATQTLRPVQRRLLPSRAIVSYLRDVLRTRSLNPPNPIIEGLIQQVVGDGCSGSVRKLPEFSVIKAYHVRKALANVKEEQQKATAKLQSFLTATTDPLAKLQLDELITLINATEEPVYTLRQMSSLLMLLSVPSPNLTDADVKLAWQKAADTVSSETEYWHGDTELAQQIHDKLQTLLDTSSDDELSWAANYLIQKHKSQSGLMIQDKSKSESYNDMAKALKQVDDSLLETKNSIVTSKLLSDMYNSIGLRHEQARLLGYSNVCEQAFANSPAELDEIRRMHSSLAERIVPQLVEQFGNKATKEEVALFSYLSRPETLAVRSRGSIVHRMDERSMLRLEQHVTLQGALQFVFRLSQDLFGITVQEQEENAQGWHRDVRLFHVSDSDDKTHLGSFYFDPFKRFGKMAGCVTMPIFPRGVHRTPTVCMSLEIEPPPWETPARVTWDDAEALFHELAHVYQFLLAQSKHGCILGPQNMPLAFSEFLPKFMEHWLAEKSTLYTLIDLSNFGEPPSGESIEAAYRFRSRAKALKIAHQTFLGTLELDLFSGFDLKGPETILNLQDRLARETVPHDVPDSKDAASLLEILQENARGRRVAGYRYLWCDVLSAGAFERFKEMYSSNPDSMSKLRADFRQLLLNPGAAVYAKAFRCQLGLDECSTDLLCKRYDL